MLIFVNLIRYSRLRLSVGCFIYFEFTYVFFYLMFLMFFSSVKGINRLKSQGIFLLKSYYWEKLMFSKLRSSKFKKFSYSPRSHWILKILVATQKSGVCKQNCMWVFYYFNFERNCDILNSKSPCILLNKNINLNKNKTESKLENPTHSFRDTNLALQLI